MAIRSILALLVLSAVSATVLAAVLGEERRETAPPVLLTATTVRPAPAPPARKPGTARVPILMYHVLGDPPADAPWPELYVRREDFAAQMRWLERHGYEVVTLRAVWKHWHDGAPLPIRPIVVSFDDGYRSIPQWALPVMRERQWPGVVNLTVRNIEVSGGLSERHVRRLIAAGWEIDAHSATHPDLTSLAAGRLASEVAGSRNELRRRFGVPVDFFCYPSGRYDEQVVAAVRRAGFLGATTTVEGLADRHERFVLRRVRVNRSDGVAGLASSLERLVGGRVAPPSGVPSVRES